MSQSEKSPVPQRNDLRLSLEDLDVVSGGATGEVVAPENGTTIIITIIDAPDQ